MKGKITLKKTRAAKAAKAKAPDSPALPTRDEILAFIAREREVAGERTPAKIGKREIARAFQITGSDKIGLKRVLKELEAEGAVDRRRKNLTKPGVLPPVVLAEVFSRDRDGDLLAKPVDWDDANGPAPTIVLNFPRRPRPGTPIPGLGDRALVRTEIVPDATGNEPAYTGRVVKLMAKARAQILGIFRALPGGGGEILPVDKKAANKGAMAVRPGDEGEAQDGDLVAAELLRGGRLGLPNAKVQERIGSFGSEKAVSLIAIHSHKIPNVFKPETLAESEAAKPAKLAGREDWRDLPLITIDPADAKDHDDAVFAQTDDDPDNPGGFALSVAIADVAAYVKPGSALDREALERGNSVYFPDRVVPMLPERISNDLCSLRPQEDRPALAMRMIIDAKGEKRGQTLHRIMMRSAAKLSYQRAQAAVDGNPDAESGPLVEPVLRPLYDAYAALKIAKARRQPLDLGLPERKILLKPDGTVDHVVTPERLDAHRLIEEFMILANVAAAELLEAKKQILIYRAHGEPSVEKIHNLGEFLQTIGIKLAKGQVLTPAQFNGILARVKGTEHEQIVNDVVLRSQAQAEYVADNYGHFGLHLRRYAHFTSPIRRYADLVVHRALIRAYKLGKDGLPDMAPDELADIALKISASERRAMMAERETVDRLIATHLVDKIGVIFQGRIAGVTRAGLFCKLADTGADGFIPAATMGTEFFRYDEASHALIGSRSGKTYRLGDTVTVKLVEAAPFAGALRFELADGEAAPSRKTMAPGLGRNPPRVHKGPRDVRSNGAKRRKR
ncbi:ribonuclease R [Beijerinckia sp. L45]|uniref:ribonuclease R n=1 Tax=Beijerinckia sp. L45 TaxID=1641855 RepID=UPI001FEE966F|nr:ribonuclease R [Beijerinckia sp. L45]